METIKEFKGELDYPQHFYLAATVLAEKLGQKKPISDIIENRKQFNDSFQVKFEVNGVSLPFAETIEELFTRMEKQIDEIAAKKAVEFVDMAGFSDIAETIRDCRYKIIDKFREKGIEIQYED
jgi:hypothetical protein